MVEHGRVLGAGLVAVIIPGKEHQSLFSDRKGDVMIILTCGRTSLNQLVPPIHRSVELDYVCDRGEIAICT